MTEITLPSVQNEISVLVVDDDQMLADLFREWVLEKWPCKSVNRGKEALENLNGDPSIILLDREMPDLHGDEVARRLRELNSTTQIMMVSGLEPDFDILDLPIENYLNKPVDRPTLQGKIEELIIRRSYDQEIQKFFAAMSKLEALETSYSPNELSGDDRYVALRVRADEIRQQAAATLGQVTDHVANFTDIQADD